MPSSSEIKRWLVVSISALSMVSLAACGGDSDSDDKAANTTSVEETAKREPATITVWDWGVPDPKVMKAVDKEYMAQNPHITIKRVNQPAATYVPPGPLLRATIARGSGPDIMATFASPFVFDYVRGIQPLNDLVTPEERKTINGWDAVTRKNGELMAYPLDANGVIFYYDKAKFQKAGLDAPPATWADLLAACDALNKAGIVPITAGWKDGGYLFWWLTLIAAQFQSEEELAKAASDPDWNSPAIQKTLDLIHEAQDRKCFTPDARGINLFPDAVNNFKSGKAAMMIGLVAGDAHWKHFRETKWGKTGLGTFLAPVVPGNVWNDKQRINYGAAFGYFVTRWSKSKQAAVDFLRYLTSPKIQERLYAEAGTAPANVNAKPAVTDPVAGQLADWARSADPYLDQFTVVGANVLGLLVKHGPQLVEGDVEYSEVADELVAAQEKQPK